MKLIITEEQFEKVKDKVLRIHYDVFDKDWSLLQDFIQDKGNPPYILHGELIDLSDRGDISTLGSVIGIEGGLIISYSDIQSLGDLTYVTGFLDMEKTNISSFGNLESVGKWINVQDTWMSRKMTKSEIGKLLNLNPYLVYGVWEGVEIDDDDV